MRADRDEVLGSALRRLDVPPHGSEFVDRMWTIADEAPGRLAPRAREAHQRAAHRRRWIMVAAATVAAVAVAAVFILNGVPGWHASTPQVAAAAEIARSMSNALRSIHTLQGSVVSDWGEGKEVGTFAVDSRGDYRWDSRITHQDNVSGWDKTTTVFNARTNTLLKYGRERGGLLSGQVTGEKRVPAPTELVSGIPFRSMAGLVRSALAEGDPRIKVTEVVFQGRDAWQAAFPKEAGDLGLSRLTVVVDQRTGVLLRYSHPGERGEHGWTYTVSHLRADKPLPTASFSTRAREGAHIVTAKGSPFCSLDQAAARAGYEPLLPRSTPGPFKLADVAAYPHVAGTAEFFGLLWPPGILRASQPRQPDEVFLRYRLGLDAFSIRQAPIADAAGRRLLEREERRVSRLSTCRSEPLKSGAFAGKPAYTWFTNAGAFLQVRTEDFCLLLSGDLTRKEMLDVADSLSASQP